MKISIPIIDNALAGLLKQLVSGVSVYNNPNQQKTSLPAFFIQHMPNMSIKPQTSDRFKRKLFFDIVYMEEYNLTALEDRYCEIAELLDVYLELIPIIEDGNTYYVRTLNRSWSVELGALHYKFDLEMRVTIGGRQIDPIGKIQSLNIYLKE
jgi:hypothetical protein